MLQLYLREIGQVKLLTPQEEIALAKRIRRGDKRAREQMIKANLRLVVKIARDYEGLGLPLLDLINEGNIGLMKGVERFDPRKGAKLSSYASWWIKQSIMRALANQSKTIRLPVHVVDKVAHIRRAEVKLREAFDRDPTDEEVAHELDSIPGASDSIARRPRRRFHSTPRLVTTRRNAFRKSWRIRMRRRPSTGSFRKPTPNWCGKFWARWTSAKTRFWPCVLGWRTAQQRTLEEVGAQLGVTRERIRQIQEQALKKLRAKMEERDRPVTKRTLPCPWRCKPPAER